MNIYEKLNELGCKAPWACNNEYHLYGVTKFYGRNLEHITVRKTDDGPVVSYRRPVHDVAPST